MSLYIGVVGYLYGNNEINEKECEDFLRKEIKTIISNKHLYEDKDNDDNVYLVTGFISKGINNIAKRISDENGYKTVGIDSIYAKHSYTNINTDYVKYIDGVFGEENEYFIKNIDVLINIFGEKRDNDKSNLAKSKGIKVIEK